MALQRKASSVGFDWNDPREVLRKIREEADEIETALDRNDAKELEGETGDLLFALVNLARHIEIDPDLALRGTNAKFERRFAHIEHALSAQGRSLESASLAEMDALWDEAKEKEKQEARPAEPTMFNPERIGRRKKALRQKRDFYNDFKLIWPVQSLAKKYSCFFQRQITGLSPSSRPGRGGVGRRH